MKIRLKRKFTLKLPDGSVVTLLPKSCIRYARKFNDNPEHTRDIYLNGQAFFLMWQKIKANHFLCLPAICLQLLLGTYFSVP